MYVHEKSVQIDQKVYSHIKSVCVCVCEPACLFLHPSSFINPSLPLQTFLPLIRLSNGVSVFG